jgi:hypothetical protein
MWEVTFTSHSFYLHEKGASRCLNQPHWGSRCDRKKILSKRGHSGNNLVTTVTELFQLLHVMKYVYLKFHLVRQLTASEIDDSPYDVLCRAGIATGYGLADRGVWVSSSRRPEPLWGPPRLLSNRHRSTPGVKRPGREADHIQLVPKSRICGPIHPLPHTPS